MAKTHMGGKQVGKGADSKGASGGGRAGQDNGRDRFADLQFFKDTDEEIKLRKEQSFVPVTRLDEQQLEVDCDTASASLDMPKRPPWDKSLTREQLDRQEKIYFKNFVDNLLEKASMEDKKLSYFDLNLDTWRQLWRVLEMSEIITIIVDIRHPLFHFPPALYNYIVDDLKKMVIIVLNKIDLVPASLVLAWQTFLKSQYPQVHIVPFASYAGMKTKSNGKRVGNMRMAADGARRFELEIEKLVGTDKIDFTSWKEKILEDGKEKLDSDESDLDSADELDGIEDVDLKQQIENSKQADNGDDDDDEDREFGKEALKRAQQIKVKNDTDFYQAEKYKDGLLTIGCVGHPNVGKSSFMNALIGKKVVSVSRTPGHTKHFQTIFLTPNIRLCDCPGLVFPSYYPKQLQVLMGCYPISQLREPYSSIQYLAERVNMVQILKLKPAEEYRHEKPGLNLMTMSERTSTLNGSDQSWSAYTICESWAVLRGFLTAKAGRPDVYRAANHLLRMALDGRTLCMLVYPPDYLAERISRWEQHENLNRIKVIQGLHNVIDADEDYDA